MEENNFYPTTDFESFFLQGYILGINSIHVFETTALHLALKSELHNIILCWFTVRCFFEYNVDSENG